VEIEKIGGKRECVEGQREGKEDEELNGTEGRREEKIEWNWMRQGEWDGDGLHLHFCQYFFLFGNLLKSTLDLQVNLHKLLNPDRDSASGK
jgi:hypothetical protein